MTRHKDDWIISSLLEDLQNLALSKADVSISDLIDTVGSRGFGPLLMVLSAFLILPIGMVPGIPAVVAVFMILIGGRMMTGNDRLWLPERVGRVSFSGHMLAVSVARAEPTVLWMRPFVAPRLAFLIDSAVAHRILALILMATGVMVLVAGFIPGLPFALSFHVLLLGLALSTRDGFVALSGYGILIGEALVIWRIFL
ncbi:Exopolysaccharide synthesis, ExoD [Rhodovulum sp. P5]|uniref:exopolysaccharide biosynthesis protein n=1 Tax=Rhodovulum sp. P5 TaxID=1564506 RepID=UPI0009C2161C|nr:exopolysaccharide biosynthesis protein [Rhodovulum sp. P5]ARE38553.1 Exopolysaccharide synthesis, ExoD [Rhodovulum sp. P5]